MLVWSAVGLLYYFLATELNGDLRVPATFEAGYQSLSESLMRGEATVTQRSVGPEAHLYNGKTAIYFGPFPALLRIALNTLSPTGRGAWARTACLVAALIACMGGVAYFREMSSRAEGGRGGGRAAFYALSCALILGSPIFFLVALPSLYHEAILWGLAASSWALYYTALPVTIRSNLGLSIAAGVALLSRLTFALPCGVVVAYRLVRSLGIGDVTGGDGREARISSPQRAALIWALLVPFLSAWVFQLWYNHARYDSIWRFDRGETPDFLTAAGGMLNAARVPYNLNKYFGAGAGTVSRTAPFLIPTTDDDRPSSYYIPYHEPLLPFSWFSPGLFLAALVGVGLAVRDRSIERILLVGAFSLQVAFILLYYFATLRFTGDLLPVIMLAAGFMLAEGARVPAFLRGTIVVSCGVSLVATPLATVSALRALVWGSSSEYRQTIEEGVRAADRFIGAVPGDSGNAR